MRWIPDPNNPDGPPIEVPDPPPATLEPPLIATSALPDGAVGTVYDQTLDVQNGTAPFAFTLTAGALPAGMALNGATGEITGTPTLSGTFNFVITVSDAASYSSSSNFSLAIPALPIIQNTGLPNGTEGEPYNAVLIATGGTAPYGFQIIGGALPAGLSLAITGGITGLPSTPGTATFIAQVYDANSPQGIGTATFSITVAQQDISGAITSLDQCVLLGCDDGALYMIMPGQRHDTDYNGKPVGFLQRWEGVPSSGGKMAENQLGGVTVGAKGSGQINVWAYDDDGTAYPMSSEKRPMILAADDNGQPVETTRDFLAKGLPKSVRWGPILDNGSAVDAWFEAHVAILWMRPFFSGRKA